MSNNKEKWRHLSSVTKQISTTTHHYNLVTTIRPRSSIKCNHDLTHFLDNVGCIQLVIVFLLKFYFDFVVHCHFDWKTHYGVIDHILRSTPTKASEFIKQK